MTPILIAPPASEPVSLAEAKAWLRLDSSDEDDLVISLIAAARLTIEAASGRMLMTQGWRLVLDSWPASGVLCIPVLPLQGVSAMWVYDVSGTAMTVSPSLYQADTQSEPGRISFLTGLPIPGRTLSGIEIDVTAGYGADSAAVPVALRQAIKTLVARWYERRGDLDQGKEAGLPDVVAALVAPFRRGRL
jgi:uncharacterized phiE125 gp8 family phage protein